MYANLGAEERRQLLSLNVLGTFIQVSIDDGPGPSIKYQYAELVKLFSVVSVLVRCCDLSSECKTQEGQPMAPNPYAIANQQLYPLQSNVSALLFKNRAFIKKIVEENVAQEDTKQLLLYLSYENAKFSAELLTELLWQVTYIYTYEMRPYLDLLLLLLLLEDSWQTNRIINTLMGFNDDKEALFDIILKSKSNYQKRAYQCIKMLTNLFSRCELANKLLNSERHMMDRWITAVEWLNEEMERRGNYGGASSQYSYNNWTPPVQSNEASNGYFLERSQSAKMCLAKALELCPEEDNGEGADLSINDMDDDSVENDNTHHIESSTSLADNNSLREGVAGEGVAGEGVATTTNKSPASSSPGNTSSSPVLDKKTGEVEK
ncbi:USP9X [Bugula neritina]|uniref:USP9X n=1 Tax=Bugula neritina TaxID=10212 RepID=A0A7J7K5D2_BUGNE|nr:USP9X [Bugula neritina]